MKLMPLIRILARPPRRPAAPDVLPPALFSPDELAKLEAEIDEWNRASLVYLPTDR